jgi:PTS hybrid protein
MTLGATGGHELTISASGDGAGSAVNAVVELVESGFGEA